MGILFFLEQVGYVMLYIDAFSQLTLLTQYTKCRVV